jgi:AraC family transcriptional regulator of adaptative response/methylated-DNA-[protein]-cysteine methyltransferase
MTCDTATLPPQTLRYGFGNSRIGLTLVGLSNEGVAAVFLGSDKAKLERELATTFPSSELVEDQEATAEVTSKLGRAIEEPSQPFELKLDVRGSQTELAVWESLRAIPVGETRTYGQIAKSLSLIVTAQEVGAACATNVLAVVIPCHRVIKAGGGISGYRWGVARKRQLLELEAAR